MYELGHALKSSLMALKKDFRASEECSVAMRRSGILFATDKLIVIDIRHGIMVPSCVTDVISLVQSSDILRAFLSGVESRNPRSESVVRTVLAFLCRYMSGLNSFSEIIAVVFGDWYWQITVKA